MPISRRAVSSPLSRVQSPRRSPLSVIMGTNGLGNGGIGVLKGQTVALYVPSQRASHLDYQRSFWRDTATVDDARDHQTNPNTCRRKAARNIPCHVQHSGETTRLGQAIGSRRFTLARVRKPICTASWRWTSMRASILRAAGLRHESNNRHRYHF